MKKLFALLTVFVAFTLLFTGCAKPKGTFSCDNYTDSYMSVNWCGYNMGVSAFDYTEYTVKAGGGTAEVYADLYGYWGSIYINVPEGGISGVTMYWSKDKSTNNKGIKVSNGIKDSTPKEGTPKPKK